MTTEEVGRRVLPQYAGITLRACGVVGCSNCLEVAWRAGWLAGNEVEGRRTSSDPLY